VYRLLYFQVIIISLLLIAGILSCAKLEGGPSQPDPLPGNSPANASYLIENDWIQLENGRAEWQAAPGLATRVQIELFGKTTRGDLNHDGDEDAILFLIYQGGGSGTFYYLGAALQQKGNYQGTNAIWLGDRIGEPSATVQNGLVLVEYLDRNHDEPMATAPSVLQTRYFILNNSTFREIKTAADEAVYQGWLTIGHEVRSFLPCDENDDLWLLGNSPTMAEIIASHKEATSDFPSYTPVFATLKAI
jgi:hypothetical protein